MRTRETGEEMVMGIEEDDEDGEEWTRMKAIWAAARKRPWRVVF